MAQALPCRVELQHASAQHCRTRAAHPSRRTGSISAPSAGHPPSISGTC